ncbi:MULTISPECIES: hypothetical protein [Niastella]|uniref:tRNA (5-methylaminomethyl-2-thiouridylate)-methyltransferase n=1 Tax=Niastella soli TaxID=2821487 RepID=A0ABS3YYL1_9BACT|nr:hypothetical protein [Niastella soli]MBO9203011.1 hypothetical protein [Niastella soli]
MTTAALSTPRVHQVYTLMRFTYGLVPIVAGLDKFTNLFTDWEKYLNPSIAQMLPFSPHTFMLIVGVIEMVAGLIVLARPAIGAYIVMAWLALIALTLLMNKGYLDVAVRDLVMSIGAYSLAQLARTEGGSKAHQATSSGVQFSKG